VFRSIRVSAARTAVPVVVVTAGATSLPRGLDLDSKSRAALTTALKTPGFTGKSGQTALGGPGAKPAGLLLGLGKKADLDMETLRKAGARLVRALDRMSITGVRLVGGGNLPAKVAAPGEVGQALAEGMSIANWRVDHFDGTATKRPDAKGTLTIAADDAAVTKGLRAGIVLGECVNEARRVAATPPNICNPAWVAREARALARKAGLTCKVIGYDEAKRLGMGGLVNVGKGSDSKPRLVILEHRPARARKGVRLVLVGKTMTYDTGGYSLKIQGSMRGMKYDGCGGCAVLGAMLAIARRKVPVHVVALLPTAENMVSGDAYRPDDIITMYNGTSVEVTNTDAEGRLILGDALAYACRKYKPTAIIDAATLTGGIVVALGKWSAGLFANDDDLAERLEEAAETTGEKVWRMPLWEEHRDFMRAKHADLWNSGPKRDGHPIQGAAFLSFFVDEDIPWAHVDIAGTADVSADTPMFVNGPTGFGVRLLTEVAESFAS